MSNSMPPALLATYFGSGERGDMYARLGRVLEYTARVHCQGWDVRVDRIEPPAYDSAMGNPSHAWNTQKLEWWRDRVAEAPDGARLLLIDSDTAILRDLSPAWDLDFDVAYTVRERGLPLNGGVVFLRASAQTRAFVESWWHHNVRFLHDAVAHRPWQLKYAGINQSALGYVLEKVRHRCRMVALPCQEWNCVAWEGFDARVTRVLHVKSKLRRQTFGIEHPQPKLIPLIKLWHQLERAERKAGLNGGREQPGRLHR